MFAFSAHVLSWINDSCVWGHIYRSIWCDDGLLCGRPTCMMGFGIMTHPTSERYEIVKACIASWFVSLSALAAGGSVTQQFPCVTTFPLSTGKISLSIIILQ